mmetsp:Transcript_4530/g.12789  ORF Transcript_4530/g.12789 Transcript_4530/m.12789 type:complete len:256 (+) Transcript_4530:2804-3571(+)
MVVLHLPTVRVHPRCGYEVHLHGTRRHPQGAHALWSRFDGHGAQLRQAALPRELEAPGLGIWALVVDLRRSAGGALEGRERARGRAPRVADAAQQHLPGPQSAHGGLVPSDAVLWNLHREHPQVDVAQLRGRVALQPLGDGVARLVPDLALHELAVVDGGQGAAPLLRAPAVGAEALQAFHGQRHVRAESLQEPVVGQLPQLWPGGAPLAVLTAMQGVDVPQADGGGHGDLRLPPLARALHGCQSMVYIVPVLRE